MESDIKDLAEHIRLKREQREREQLEQMKNTFTPPIQESEEKKVEQSVPESNSNPFNFSNAYSNSVVSEVNDLTGFDTDDSIKGTTEVPEAKKRLDLDALEQFVDEKYRRFARILAKSCLNAEEYSLLEKSPSKIVDFVEKHRTEVLSYIPEKDRFVAEDILLTTLDDFETSYVVAYPKEMGEEIIRKHMIEPVFNNEAQKEIPLTKTTKTGVEKGRKESGDPFKFIPPEDKGFAEYCYVSMSTEDALAYANNPEKFAEIVESMKGSPKYTAYQNTKGTQPTEETNDSVESENESDDIFSTAYSDTNDPFENSINKSFEEQSEPVSKKVEPVVKTPTSQPIKRVETVETFDFNNFFSDYKNDTVEDVYKTLNVSHPIFKQKEDNFNKAETKEQEERKEEYSDVVENVWNTKQPYDDIVPKRTNFSYNGKSIEYSVMSGDISFTQSFSSIQSEDDLAENYVNFTKEVCEDIEKLCGGWGRVTSLAVISDDIIINGVAYKPTLSKEWLASLPFDLKIRLADSRYAWVFDFVHLKEMTNLTDLKFDSLSFVRAKVRGDVNLFTALDYGTFFRMCKRLNDIEIAGQHVTRAEYNAKAIQSDLFKKPSNAFLDNTYDFCNTLTKNFTKNRFQAITDMFHNPNASALQKAWGMAWRTPLLMLGVTGQVATKGGGLLRKMIGGLRNVVDAVKENK